MNNIIDKRYIVDEEFGNLFAPLSKKEFKQLENDILRDGCHEPIVLWNNTIIDGHNRYNICLQHNIPFSIRHVFFSCKEEAISWICSNQLGRRDITKEVRRYLIGKKYQVEKTIGIYKRQNDEQIEAVFDTDKEVCLINRGELQAGRHILTAEKLGELFNISHYTVYKYGTFSKIVDKLIKYHPTIANKILSGELNIPLNNVCELEKLDEFILSKIDNYIETHPQNHNIRYIDVKRNIIPVQQVPLSRKKVAYMLKQDKNIPIIKMLPAYDPDADFTSLAYTIPSWISSIQRAKMNSQMGITSVTARTRLIQQLAALKENIELLLQRIEELE